MIFASRAVLEGKVRILREISNLLFRGDAQYRSGEERVREETEENPCGLRIRDANHCKPCSRASMVDGQVPTLPYLGQFDERD